MITKSIIDKPEDCTPDTLRLYAKQVRYAGRDHTATVIEWCADLLAKKQEQNNDN